MTTTLENRISELELSISKHNAMSGSVYYTINGIKFRISDHIQPSHYQSRNYFDVYSEESILNIVSNELFTFYANPIREDDRFINAVYNEKNDSFKITEINENEYNELVLKMKAKKDFYIANGFVGDITF